MSNVISSISYILWKSVNAFFIQKDLMETKLALGIEAVSFCEEKRNKRYSRIPIAIGRPGGTRTNLF